MLAWQIDSREVALQSSERNTVFFHREVVSCIISSHARGHVRSAAHASSRLMMHQHRLALHTMRDADGALEVVDTTRVAVLTEVVIGMDLVQVANTIHVTWVEHELVGFGGETREEGEWDDKE